MSTSLDLALIPKGGNAVMAGRAVEQLNENDYFPTHPWAARAGAELIRRLDPYGKKVWEPAVGEGHMAHGLAEYFGVFGSDLVDYGQPWQTHGTCDFTGEAAEVLGERLQPDWIVSNPPFVLGEDFVRRGWELARRGVAMLLRLQFTEGGGRHAMFTRDCPLALSATFSERVPMFVGRWDPGRSSTTAYRWFFFLKPDALDESPMAPAISMAREVGCNLETLIGPGTRARLERREDLLTFGPLSVAACRRMATELAGSTDPKAGKRAAELVADADRIQALLTAAGDPLFGGGG
jgi:hypothetical protein